jgi:cellulose synthase/poly-beta-1,6-N-acetylglucosamine synthase-like glycosyltransferase
VLLSQFLVCLVALVVMTSLLLVVGHRLRFAFRPLGIVLAAVLAIGSGEAASAIWRLPTPNVLVGEALLFVSCVLVVLLRRRWNPVGQLFLGTFVASALTYLLFAADITFASGLTPIATVASAGLLFLEIAALTLSASFAFESLDVVCRTRWDRTIPDPDPEYLPMVSLQIAAYNEPPDMLIETIRSVEAIDYPRFELVVIDNNTKDPETWRPVEAYCRDRPNITFVHVDPWPGYKSGALNLALSSYTAPDAEIVGVIDADYLVDPSYLRSLVGYFADPGTAFVQSPQDYREFEHDTYLTALYDAYHYFFLTSMPSRNERNSIIFAGTMGLLRRNVLEKLGGWDEWCITEDAEASLRMLKAGYSGLYVNRSFGRGIMPLTFTALKSQRFRWCFGGMQILRSHLHDLVPWNRDPDNHMTTGQRVDYLLGGLQWLNDLVNLGFTAVLLTMASVLLAVGRFGLRPLLGVAVLLPVALIGSGILRAQWALRTRARIGRKRAWLAFASWLSLSWTVALACVQGLVRRRGVFLRTPKESDRASLAGAFWSARTETVLAVALWTMGLLTFLRGTSWFVLALFVWQGCVYATAPFMSWLNQHTELSAQLERRRRSEWRREKRFAAPAPLVIGAFIGALVVAAFAAALVGGGAGPAAPGNPFALPQRSPGDQGPIGQLVGGDAPSQTPTVTVSPGTGASASPSILPSPSTTPSASPSPSPTGSGTTSPSAPPTSSPSPSASATPTPTAAPTPPTSGSPAATTDTRR